MAWRANSSLAGTQTGRTDADANANPTANRRARMKPQAKCMKALELIGNIDENRQLHAEVPESLPTGPVRLIVLVPEEDEAGMLWMQGLSKEWSEELADVRQDIYTLEDGQPVDAPRCGFWGR
jgi:hypothetical protein